MTAVLARTPRPVYDALRPLRTALYRLVGPLDYVVRTASGRRDVPPLWLRRHVGPLASFDRAAGEMTAVIADYGLLRDGARVLDIGCGCGAMVPDFRRMIGSKGQYVGFDVHEPSIGWCRRQFARDPRLRFELSRVHTPYSTEFRAPVSAARFPTDDAWADFILAKSVFTHLLPDAAEQYLREIARVLAPGGRALVSAFLLSADAPVNGGEPLYRFPFGDASVRWMFEARPTAGVAYEEAHLRGMMRAAGVVATRVTYGYWRGGGIAPNAQDLLVIERATGG